MKNCTQSFIISNLMLVKTPVKLRNSQIHENCQLWYNLNYINFSQGFQHIFEIHIIRKIFLKYIDPVTTLRGGNKNEGTISKMKILLLHQYQIIHCYENLCRSVVLNIFMYTSITYWFVYSCISGAVAEILKKGGALLLTTMVGWWRKFYISNGLKRPK